MHTSKIAALALAVSLLAGVSACASNTNASKSGQSAVKEEKAAWDEKQLQTQEKDGVISLVFPNTLPPQDLVVQVLEEGNGQEVTEQDFVLANYTGQVWGSEKHFDSSFTRGVPSGFSLQHVIEGWTKGLAGKKVGSKVVVIVPPQLGYGKSGGNANAGIGPDDVIAFYVELVDAYGLNQANEKSAKPEADLAALPVEITGENGAPVQIKVKPDQQPPTAQAVTVIARGSGEAIKEKDSDIYLQFAMTLWDNTSGETTYGKYGPQSVKMGAGTIFDALKGVPVGSRVLITAPKIETTAQDKPIAVVVDILGQLPHHKANTNE